jgi:hypothetical protein
LTELYRLDFSANALVGTVPSLLCLLPPLTAGCFLNVDCREIGCDCCCCERNE